MRTKYGQFRGHDGEIMVPWRGQNVSCMGMDAEADWATLLVLAMLDSTCIRTQVRSGDSLTKR